MPTPPRVRLTEVRESDGLADGGGCGVAEWLTEKLKEIRSEGVAVEGKGGDEVADVEDSRKGLRKG